MIRVRAGVSTSQVASLGSTQNQPDPVRLQDGRPTADCEKPRVESNQAQVDCGRIQLRLKNTNQEPNLVQISQIQRTQTYLQPKHQ